MTRANRKFIARFAYMEKSAKADLKDLTLLQLDALWEAAKRAGL